MCFSRRGYSTLDFRNCNNGFASGPPWPTQKREKPWATVCVWKKQQQIKAIEKEINVLATESLVGLRSWRLKFLFFFLQSLTFKFYIHKSNNVSKSSLQDDCNHFLIQKNYSIAYV